MKAKFHFTLSNQNERFEIILHNILSRLNANSYITNQQSITNSHSLSDSNKSINYLVGWNKQNKNYKSSIDVRNICLIWLDSQRISKPREACLVSPPPLLNFYCGAIYDFLINFSPAIPVNVKRFLPLSLLSHLTIDPSNPDLAEFQSPVVRLFNS